MAVKGVYLAIAGGGAILLYSGIRGHKWTTTLRDIVSGSKLPQTQDLAIQSSPTAGGAGLGTLGGINSILPAGGSASKNMAIAKVLCIPYGWATGSNWNSLVSLWNQESGWSVTAKNPSSGAYGIPQALPASKMASAGANWQTSAATQIRWGLAYIHSRYGSPDNAWAHEQSQGWY